MRRSVYTRERERERGEGGEREGGRKGGRERQREREREGEGGWEGDKEGESMQREGDISREDTYNWFVPVTHKQQVGLEPMLTAGITAVSVGVIEEHAASSVHQ